MIDVIKPSWNAPTGISAFCTTRRGGVSTGPYDNLNLALHVGDDPLLVERNRELLRQQLQLPAEPQWLWQTHGTRSVNLDLESDRDADAAVTAQAGKVAVVMTADCLPILLCNRSATEVAAVHAGWRGLQAGVVQSAIASMSSPAAELMAWVGPAISQDRFEVGEEVLSAFCSVVEEAAVYFVASRPGHWLCDLAGLAAHILRTAGLPEVVIDPHCSYSDQEMLYSYRREAITGRMASLIWIN